MPRLNDKSKNIGRRFIVMALVGLLLLLAAMPGYHMFAGWRRYQQQRLDIITIRKGGKYPTRFEFQGPRKERYKIPTYRPFAEDLSKRVQRIRVHVSPEDKVRLEKLSHFKHVQELELTIESPFRLELPAELTELSNVTELTLVGNGFGDLSAVATLTKLKSLNLVAPKMPGIPDLTHLHSLKRVQLVADRLSPADWAHNLPPLERLVLLSNHLDDVTSLAHMQKLDLLTITGESHNLAPLTRMASLRQLTVHDASVNSEVVNRIPGLQKLAIRNADLVDPDMLSKSIELIRFSAEESKYGWRDACMERWPRSAMFLEQEPSL